MKRTLFLLLAFLLLFSGCGQISIKSGTGPETAVPAQSESQAPPADASTADAETTTAAEETGTAAAETTAAPTEAGTTAPPATDATTKVPASAQPQTTAPPQTTAAPTTAPPTTRPPANTCVIRIECGTILNNMNKLKTGKAPFVPADGVILNDTEIVLQPGDTVFTVLQRACAANTCPGNCVSCQRMHIQLEYNYTPGFNTYYVEGIHQLYEMDCGSLSGWMFSVNGKFPEEGASSVPVSPGDRIVFAYTCDMGDDIGNHFEG